MDETSREETSKQLEVDSVHLSGREFHRPTELCRRLCP